MKVTAFILAIGASAALGTGWGQNSTAQPASVCSADTLPLWQSLWTELRSLRQELVEQRRAAEQAKTADLQRQLQGIQAQQRALEDDRGSRDQQLAAVEAALVQSNLEKNERDDLESQKAQLLSAPSGASPAVQNAISQQEARVRDQLAEQEQRAGALDQLARQLAGGARQ